MTSILKVDELQDTSGNLIIKEDSNTITIGASGDTITYSIWCNNTRTLEQPQVMVKLIHQLSKHI